MYLHIGRDWMIAYRSIVGLFPMAILDASPEFRHMFYTWRVEDRVLGNPTDAKTIVLTDDRMFLSSISPYTLLRRVQRGELDYE